MSRVGSSRTAASLAFAFACAACGSADRPEADQTRTDASSGFDAALGPSTAAPGCDQQLADGRVPPSSTWFIEPRVPVVPFYQWESNNGYCGETSMIEAGMNNGQWISQYNARLLCGAAGNGRDAPVGAPLLQAGPRSYCGAHDQTPDYNAQLLLESAAAANAAQCLSNYRLAFDLYDPPPGAVGMAGYEAYMAWVKAKVVAGAQVTIGVFEPGGTDSQYDHIVTVTRVGTNHDVTDTRYYGDDVLYLEDHGAYTFANGAPSDNPAVPPGAGSDAGGCTPYIFAFAFSELPATREQANAASAPAYTILIPGLAESQTHTGGDGVGYGPSVTGQNYAFAVSGPAASSQPTLPVVLRVARTETRGVTNPDAPVAGFDYENPYIGTSDDGASCTDSAPTSWMSMTLDVTVGGLTAGTAYRLYEYDLPRIIGLGEAAALDVPTESFNARSGSATYVASFVADGPTYATSVTRDSDITVVFRAVRADAP